MLCVGREGAKDAVSARTRGNRAKGTSSGHETKKWSTNIQHLTTSRSRIFLIACKALRRSLQPELRRGGRAICQYAKLRGLLQRGEHQQSRPRVSQVPE